MCDRPPSNRVRVRVKGLGLGLGVNPSREEGFRG